MRALPICLIAATAGLAAPAAAGCGCAAKPVRHHAVATGDESAATVHVFRGVSLEESAPAPLPEGRSFLPAVDTSYGWAGGLIDDDGAAFLDPWLSDTSAGRAFVTWNFDRDRNGVLRRREAVRANAAFASVADADGDGRLSEAEIDAALDRFRP